MNEINRVNNNRINFRGVDKMDNNVEKSEISLSDVKEMIDQMKDEVKSRMYDKNIYPPKILPSDILMIKQLPVMNCE